MDGFFFPKMFMNWSKLHPKCVLRRKNFAVICAFISLPHEGSIICVRLVFSIDPGILLRQNFSVTRVRPLIAGFLLHLFCIFLSSDWQITDCSCCIRFTPQGLGEVETAKLASSKKRCGAVPLLDGASSSCLQTRLIAGESWAGQWRWCCFCDNVFNKGLKKCSSTAVRGK